MTVTRGWFFDAYPVQNGMRVWMLAEHGDPVMLFDAFEPCFYLRLDGLAIDLAALSSRYSLPMTWTQTQRMELFSGRLQRVTCVTVRDLLQFSRCVRTLARFLP
ncbi:MAG: hypothetical protein FJY97_13450, partial [candidate division Zixibacteria bacterium]|nr:hypothetical protein [candidate division Zixibacteria bacterium]